MALFEDIQYTEKGAMANNSLMQYKIPSRLDVGKIRVEFKQVMKRVIRSVQNQSGKL